MGIYHLLLTYMVLYSHMRVPGSLPFNTGVVAVVSFLMLSGFVMTALIRKYYSKISFVKKFYIDRFFRLTPQFIFYSAITFLLAHFGLRHTWMRDLPSIQSFVIQLTMVPLNFYMIFPNMLLPQAWSLGLECFFYLSFPFVLIFNKRALVFYISFIIFLIACLGYINSDLWAYRYLPGTFFIFIVGSFIFESKTNLDKMTPLYLFLISVIIFIYSYYSSRLIGLASINQVRSELFGLIVAIPLILAMKKTEKENSANFSIGDLSYGVFLNHNLIIGLILLIYPAPIINFANQSLFSNILIIVFTMVVSTGISFLSFLFIEKPFINYRKKKRLKSIII